MKLTKRETATVLAALRYWQREGWISSGHERDIATDGDTLKELTKDEIDALCERINCGESDQSRWLIWSKEHRQWWAPGRAGYVKLKTKAGRYTFAEAVQICRDANCWLHPGNDPEETMLLATEDS